MDMGRRSGWCSVLVCAGIAAATCSQLACSASSREGVGAVRIAITTVPGDVLCVQITAQGTRTVFQQFNVIPGDSPMLLMPGLPLGDTKFSAAAFASRCGTDNLTPTPTWVSDPVFATIVQNIIAQIELVMHRNGRASISIAFPDDPTCVPEGGACGVCCPGTRCDGTTGLCVGCISDGEACDPTQLCCGGLACTTGICGDAQPCVADGLTCDGTRPCCSSGVECLGGTCGGCVAEGTACDGRQPCCSGSECAAGTCGGCLADGLACDGRLPCCTGAACQSGTCGGPECAIDGTACGGLLHCCTGLMCNAGICGQPICTETRGALCDIVLPPAPGPFPCCPGVPCSPAAFLDRNPNRFCGGCIPDMGSCNSPSCCGGACINDVCNGPRCSPDGAACNDTHSCCSGMTCSNGICEGPACVNDGAACDGARPCCSGVSCTGGICGGLCLADGTACEGAGTCCSTGLPCLSGTCDVVIPWVVLACVQVAGLGSQLTEVTSDGNTYVFSGARFGSAGGPARQIPPTGRISGEALTTLLSAARTLDSSQAGFTTTIGRNTHSTLHSENLTSAGALGRSTLVDSVQDGASIGRYSSVKSNDVAANEIRKYCSFQ
jgi:hypothetical protein